MSNDSNVCHLLVLTMFKRKKELGKLKSKQTNESLLKYCHYSCFNQYTFVTPSIDYHIYNSCNISDQLN